MSDLLAQLVAENKAIRESREPRLVVERIVVAGSEIAKVEVQESDGSKSTSYRLAKVAQADVMNQNHRVYPRKEWVANVERATEDLIPNGRLIGAVDHTGPFDGGNLKDSPIIWKRLEIKDNGAIEGEFVVIAKHSKGADLQAQLDAGMAIGFSTVGYANGHEPSDDERKQYGIPEDDEAATVLESYRLKKIDAVDDPSVIDAWTKNETPAAARNAEATTGGPVPPTEKVMKTLEDLKSQHPELFTLHEQAVQAAVAAKQAELLKQIEDLQAKHEADKKAMQADMDAMKTKCDMMQSQCDEMKSQCDRVKKSLGESVQVWAKDFGVEVPSREISEKETAEKIDALTKAGEAKDTEIATLKAEIEKAAKEAKEREEAAAEAKRVADVNAKLAELLKDSRFAEQIKKATEKCIASKSFDVKAVEAFVKEKTEEYEAVAKTPVSPEFGITGITALGDQQKQGESQDEPLPIAKQMAEAL